MSIISEAEDAIPVVSQVKLILGGVMVAGVVGFALWVWRVDHLRAQYKAEVATVQAQLKAESAANQLTAASLAQAQAIIASDNAQSAARAKAYSDSKTAEQANNTKNDTKEAATAPQRAALDAIAKVPGGSVPCKAPDALTANLRGL